MPSSAQSMIAAFTQGKQLAHQREQDEIAQEDRKLQQDLLKHRLAQMKMEDRILQFKAKTGAAEDTIKDIASTSISTLPASQKTATFGALPAPNPLTPGEDDQMPPELSSVLASLGQQPAAVETMSQRPNPVTMPGFPEMGIPERQVQPLTLEDNLAQQAAIRYQTMMTTPRDMAPDHTYGMPGQDPVMVGAPKPPQVDMSPQASMEGNRRVWQVFDPKTGAMRTVPGGAPIPPAASQSAAGAGPELTTVIDQRPDKESGNQIVPGTGSTANAIFQDAMSYALEGKMPTMGMGSSPRIANARSAIRNTAGALVAAAGVDMPTLRAEYRANATSLNRMIPLYNQTVAFADSALASARMAEQAGQKVFRTGIPVANRMYNWLNKTLKGNDKLTEFEVFVFTAARDYAKVTSGGALSIAELSVQAAAKADELLNAAQTPEAFRGAIRGIERDMANVMDTQRTRIGAVAQTVARFLDATNPPPVSADDYAARAAQPQTLSGPQTAGTGTGWALGDQPRSLVGPDGGVVTFPTDAAFKAAQKDVGLGAVPAAGPGGVQTKTTKFGTFESTDGGVNWTKVGG